MPLYRKKPVEIEAVEFRGFGHSQGNGFDLISWVDPDGNKAWGYNGDFLIETLEGVMTARPGDYIIKGVQGEFYPCKPDIFLQTYEPVEETGLERVLAAVRKDRGGDAPENAQGYA